MRDYLDGMSAEDFAAFEAKMRDKRGWKTRELAAALGAAQLSLKRWREGGGGRQLALACAALDKGLEPFRAKRPARKAKAA